MVTLQKTITTLWGWEDSARFHQKLALGTQYPSAGGSCEAGQDGEAALRCWGPRAVLAAMMKDSC